MRRHGQQTRRRLIADRPSFARLSLVKRSAASCAMAMVALTGCSPRQSDARTVAAETHSDSLARAGQDSVNRTLPGYVIDSIIPVDEGAHRFRSALGGDSLTTLQRASGSRQALVRRFLRGLANHDTAALLAMSVSAREFVDLVYPSSPFTHAPYRQSAGLSWMLIRNPSQSGLTRLLRRAADIHATYVDHRCATPPERQGRNVIWTSCSISVRAGNGQLESHRYLGSILERDGRFKVLSFRNEW